MADSLDDLIAIGDRYREQLTAPAFDAGTMPRMAAPQAQASEADKHGLVYNALRTGWNEAQGLTDQAVAAGLKLAGADQMSADWSQSAAEQNAEADRYRMNNLEIAPWREGGSWANLPQQALYQALKQAPNLAAGIAGGFAAEAALPATAFTGAAGAAAGRVMGMLGGEGTAEAGAAALRQGVGSAATAYPQGVGSMYGEAVDRGDATAADAGKAMIMGVPYAALEGVEAPQMRGIFSKVLGGESRGGVTGAVRDTLADGARAFVSEAAVEGVQTAMEQSFRPDLTFGQKANNVVDAMFMGGIGGGTIGSVTAGAGHALRAYNTMPATRISDDPAAMADAIDSTLGRDTPPPAPPGAPPTGPETPPGAPPAAPGMTEAALESAPAPIVNPGEPANPQEIAPAAPVAQAPEAPTAPFDSARPLGHLPDEVLLQQGQTLDPASPAFQTLREEVARRVQERDPASPQKLETDRQIAREELRKQIIQEAQIKGQDRKALNRLQAEDMVGAYDEVDQRLQDALESGKRVPNAIRKAGEYFGIIDANGERVDLPTKLTQLQDALEATTNGTQREQIGSAIQTVQRQMDLAQQSQTRKTEAAEAAQQQETARAADAQAQMDRVRQIDADNETLGQAQQLTERSMQARMREQQAELPTGQRKDFAAGVRAFNAGKEAPTDNPAQLAGHQFAQRYIEAKNLVENTNAEAPNAAEQPAQTVGVDGAPVEGNAPGAGSAPGDVFEALRQQGPGPIPTQGQVGQGAPVQGRQGRAGRGVQGAPAEGQGQGVQGAPAEGQAVPVQITPEAEQLLASVDAGGVPWKVTENLARVARANGIRVTGTTGRAAGHIVEQLRAMRDAQRNAAPGPRPSVASQQAAATPASTASSEAVSTAPRSAPETARAVGAEIAEVSREVAAAESMMERETAPPSPPSSPPGSTPPSPPGSPPYSGKRLTSRGNWFNKTHLYMTTSYHIAKFYQKVMPAAMRFVDAQQQRQDISERLSAAAMQALKHVDKLSAAEQANLSKLMARVTDNKVNPLTANWSDHRHIIGVVSREREAQLKEVWRETRAAYDRIRRTEAGEAFRSMLAYNNADRFAHQTVMLQRAVELDPSIPKEIRAAIGDPMMKFLRTSSANESPKEVRRFWASERERTFGLVEHWLGTVDERMKITRSPEERRAMAADKKLLDGLVKEYNKEYAALLQYPYFHLGRFGDYAVSFHFKAAADGRVEPEVMIRIQNQLRGLGYPVTINEMGEKNYAFIRVDNVDAMNRLNDVLRTMPEVDQSKAITRLTLEQAGETMTKSTKALMEKMITELRGSTSWDSSDPDSMAQREKAEKFIRQFVMEALPDQSIDRALSARESVPGYDENMIRSFSRRAEMGAMSLARMSGTGRVLDALGEMNQQRKLAEIDSTKGDSVLLGNIYRELSTREYLRTLSGGNSIFDTLKGLNYTYFMGLNPSHAVLQFVSVPILLLPELAKRTNIGFMKASSAIGRATTDAFKIMREVMREGFKGDWSKATSTLITQQILTNALPGAANAAKRNFMLRVINSGAIDTGSESREIGRRAQNKGGKLDLFFQYANAMGYYAETTNRLISALASHDLNGSMDIEDQVKDAIHTVNESMFNFANFNVSRLMGRSGFLGPATPLVTAFQSYNAQLMEKLYREANQAFGNDTEGLNAVQAAEQKRQARVFLGYHLAAVVSTAGVLGLPFASVFAAVFDKLADELGGDDDDEPWDVRAKFRGWMDATLGHTASDALTRGLPRLIGTDISERAGEANLMPFSQFAADRAQWRDAFGHLEQRGFGSPASAVSNLLGAVDKFNGGDYFGAARAFMPQGVKNFMDAYQMTDKGYVDSKGNKMPLSVGAEDVLRKAIGFKGDREADFAEVKQIDNRQKLRLQQESGPIMKNLIDAIQNKDGAAARSYLQQAEEYDAQHPTRAILPKIASRLQSSLKAQAIESSTGMPANIRLDDPQLMGNLSWYQGRVR